MEKLVQGADPGKSTPPAPEGPGSSQAYLLRLWREEANPGKPQWRGKIQNVLSPEARFFSSWPAFVQILTAMMPDTAGDETEPRDPEGAAGDSDPPSS